MINERYLKMGMNITIEQADIETAVEKYVRELIPGLGVETVVKIDLAATRGPAGFTASIRLLTQNEADAEVAQPEPQVKATPTKVKTSGTKPLNIAQKAAEAKATAPAEVPAEAEPAVEEGQSEEEVAREADTTDLNAPIEEESPTEEDAAEEQAQEEAEAQPEPLAEEAPRKSLFAKMEKPKN